MQSERLTTRVTRDVAGKVFHHSRDGLRVADEVKEKTEWINVPQIRLGGAVCLTGAIVDMMRALRMHLRGGRMMLWCKGRAVR